MAEPILLGRGLGHRFGRNPWLWRDLDITIERGEVLVVLGPNGRGKSTLLRALAGQLRPERGTVAVRVPLTYVPQSYSPPFAFTALDLVLAGRSRRVGLFGQPSIADEDAAVDALHRVGMAWAADRSFPSLSGGERQLVALARALAAKADLIILDEPLAALDLKHQHEVLAALKALASSGRHALVFTAHDPNHAHCIADQAVLLMSAGDDHQGPTQQILTNSNLTNAFGIKIQSHQYGNDESQLTWVVRSRS